MNLPLKWVANMIGVSARDFASGWMEGRTRYQGAQDKRVIPGSFFKAGSVAFAASQAAVGFYEGLEK